MDPQGKAKLEAQARVIKSMAHPSRLLMLKELEKGERCVCELQRLVGSDMSTVSKHLGVLRNAGVVADERRGAQVYYRLRVPCVLGFLDCVEAVLEANARRQAALLDAGSAEGRP